MPVSKGTGAKLDKKALEQLVLDLQGEGGEVAGADSPTEKLISAIWAAVRQRLHCARVPRATLPQLQRSLSTH